MKKLAYTLMMVAGVMLIMTLFIEGGTTLSRIFTLIPFGLLLISLILGLYLMFVKQVD